MTGLKPSDLKLAVALLLVLILLTILAGIQQTQAAEAPALASFSTAPQGARALRLWVAELGYAVNDRPLTHFAPPAQAGLIFMLEPATAVTEQEWEALDDWVASGGVLVVAGQGIGTLLALRHYEFRLLFQEAESLSAAAPLLAAPPLPATVATPTRAYLQTNRDDIVVHLADGPRPVLVSWAQGDGRVFVSAAVEPFSNAGLKEGDNAAVVLNLISAAMGHDYGRDAVWFNEWHHGLRGIEAQIVGPGQWLRHTAAGHAILYTAGIIFLALLLHGQRFGRPVPLPQASIRRAPLEYITAIANMKRRAGHRTAVLAHYHQTLKRALGRRYRLAPALPDAEFVSQLGAYNPALDTAALRTLLSRLRRPTVSERELVELAVEVTGWLET